MGSVSGEEGVLKLVHPGRHVEIHTKPITAAEVLQKYPRHSVTRPDVFKYPWIVVKPESVLNLGRVFFIVPNRTIYNLVKAQRESQQQSQEKSQISKHHVKNKQVQNSSSPVKSHAGSTPKHLDRHHREKLNQSPTIKSCIWMPSLDQDLNSRTRKQNKVSSWPEVTIKPKNANFRLEEEVYEDSRTKIRYSYQHKDNDICTDNMTADCDRNDGDLEFNHGKEVAMFKSCLRKPDSDVKLLKKVSFLLPTKEEEQQRRVKVYQREEFAGNSCSFADFFVHSTSLVPM
ncbi:hypothetical protein JCGZ_17548 [Jatropha curcas]|uniref:Uncharacterized protein n=1 Tax=Jatropha curcas TaxID=180498 RepID=A0A067K296_JATCU|nr:hypothetical protein JCGZ_17548 [Jatropha curcas]